MLMLDVAVLVETSAACDPGSAFTSGAPSADASGFDSFSFCSRPSTLLSSASRTSVFGPLFFGTASRDYEEKGKVSTIIVIITIIGKSRIPSRFGALICGDSSGATLGFA